MRRLVVFTEFKNTRREKNAETYLINPDDVGAVLPRKDYTTLLVQGVYFHVNDSSDVVLEKLAMRTWFHEAR